MKKIFPLLFFVLFVMSSKAQTKVNFTLNKKCEYIITDSLKNYYVFYFDGNTQSTLFNKVLIGVTKTFLSAKDVVSKVDNSLISINSTHRIVDNLLDGLIVMTYDVNYIIEFEFKDGKIKVNAPSLVSIKLDGEDSIIDECLLTPSGELAKGWEKYLFVNDIINKILTYVNPITNDDW